MSSADPADPAYFFDQESGRFAHLRKFRKCSATHRFVSAPGISCSSRESPRTLNGPRHRSILAL